MEQTNTNTTTHNHLLDSNTLNRRFSFFDLLSEYYTIKQLVFASFFLMTLFSAQQSMASCYVNLPSLSESNGCAVASFVPYANYGTVEFMWAENVDGYIYSRTAWSTSTSLTFCPSSAGYYRLCARSTNYNGCDIYETGDIYITACTNPTITPYVYENGWIQDNTISVCEGTTVYLGAQAGIQNYVSLTYPDGSIDNTADGSTYFTLTSVSVSDAGTYTMTYTDYYGCSDTQDYILTVNDSPELVCEAYANGSWSVLADCTISMCEGEALKLSVNPNVSDVDWVGPNGFSASNSNDINLGTLDINEAGDYTATLTDGNGCSASTTITVTVNTNPASGFAYQINGGSWTDGTSIPALCAGESISVSYWGCNADWTNRVTGPNSFDQTTVGACGNVLISNTLTTAMEGDYVMTTTNADGCEVSVSFSITIDALPEVTSISTTDETCSGGNNGTITCNFKNDDNKTNIEFSIDGGNTWPSAYNVADDAGSITIDGLAPGTYDLKVRWGDDACEVDVADQTIAGGAALELAQYIKTDNGSFELGNSKTICAGQEILLDLEGNPSNDWTITYKRLSDNTTFPGGTGGVDIDQIKITETTDGSLNEGTWEVTYMNAEGCSNIETFIIDIDATPNVTSIEKTDISCEETTGTITFNFSDQSGRSHIEFSIDGGNNWPSIFKVADNSTSLTVSNIGLGTYDLWVRWGNDECPIDLEDITILGPAEPCVLPVELVYFEAKGSETSVQLDWLTASEENNDYFEIERSDDGRNWEVISKVAGQGTIGTETYYSIEDKQPLEGLSYYRLNQVDFDGTFTYSELRSITMETKETITLNVYPSPATDIVYLEANKELESGSVQLLNQFGVRMNLSTIEKNSNRIGFDISQLPGGIYFLSISKDNQLKTKRFIVGK